jgi:DNA-binding transcriptional ArsR family regulator
VLTISFTPEDLGRVRVRREPNYTFEVTLAAAQLRNQNQPAGITEWRRRIRPGLVADGHRFPWVKELTRRGIIPEFLDPAVQIADRTQAPSVIAGTPPGVVQAYLREYADHKAVPSTIASITDHQVLRQVGEQVCGFYDLAVAPFAGRLDAAVEADLALRSRLLATTGTEGLLETLHPQVRWRYPLLEVALPGFPDWRVDLNGRGLQLQPSVFVGAPSLFDVDDDVAGTPTLVYPVYNLNQWLRPPSNPEVATPLDALLGTTRSAVLAAVGTEGGVTTTELARLLAVSPSTTSEHAAVLRASGLLTSHRRGRNVIHTLSPLGSALLAAGRPAEADRVRA